MSALPPRIMPEFSYKARNGAGEDVIGTITAASKREAPSVSAFGRAEVRTPSLIRVFLGP